MIEAAVTFGFCAGIIADQIFRTHPAWPLVWITICGCIVAGAYIIDHALRFPHPNQKEQ